MGKDEIKTGLKPWFGADRIIAGVHPLDVFAAWLTCGSKLFSRGWGDESLLADLSERTSFAHPPAPISVDWSTGASANKKVRRDGTFASPLSLLPKEARTVHVRAWSQAGNVAACVVLEPRNLRGVIFAEGGSQEQPCVDGAKTKSALESLADNDIHRLVRVTARKRSAQETASEIAAPNHPRFVTIVMDLGLGSNPNLHRALKRPIQSADRSMATVGWRRLVFPAGLGSKPIQNVR